MKDISFYTNMNRLLICALVFPLLFTNSSVSFTLNNEPVVHAVLFYSPNCGHCHLVITEVLPSLFEQYNDQLILVGVDVSQYAGQVLFMNVLQHFNLGSGGVPFLVVGDTYLVGSIDIPEKFPGLIEQHLAQGGVDWPAIPGLAEAMASAQTTEATAPVESTPTIAATNSEASPTPVALNPTSTPGMLLTGEQTDFKANFARDLLGNTLAVIVLASMILSVVGVTFSFLRVSSTSIARAALAGWRDWLIPVSCLIGLGVAGYLAYVETTHVEAFCGPVGDCNTVQQSAHARLFGVLPIGILGVIGYVMILLAWVVGHSARKHLAAFASLALFVLAAFGVLFSIYLTFLEPFVIGATCAWCLTSAIIMTALFWLSFAPARAALSYILDKEKYIFVQSRS